MKSLKTALIISKGSSGSELYNNAAYQPLLMFENKYYCQIDREMPWDHK